jgi:chemotaxis signal transduction protein
MDNLLKNSHSKKILAERAALIATEKNNVSLTEHSSILVFEVGAKQKYGMPYTAVDKVIPSQKITPVPGVNPFFSGIIYNNSEVYPIVNTFKLLNCTEFDEETNFILLHTSSYRYGFKVGAIIGRTLYDKSEELVNFHTDTKKQSYILGIYQTDVALVDMKAIFNILNTI